MPNNATGDSSMVPAGRLIPTLQADGYTQMALDQMLLEQCQTSKRPHAAFLSVGGTMALLRTAPTALAQVLG
jgi:hypothetical protein